MSEMTAEFILEAIRFRYNAAAIVTELTIEDQDLADSGVIAEGHRPVELGCPHHPEGHKYERRIDALMFETLIRTAIEVKVTVADFRRDTYWKRRAWQRVTHRFVYAVPHDLDVMTPHGIGLWKVHPDGRIDIVKKAIINRTPDALPQSVIQRIAYKARLRPVRDGEVA